MNYAVLGVNDRTLELVREIVDSHVRKLIAVYEPAEFAERIEQLAPGSVTSEDWEALLHASDMDVVVVTGTPGDERRVVQLRKLVQAGVPLLVVHPACEPIVALELDMIRDDTNSPLVPFIPDAISPVADEAIATAQRLGKLEQLTLERRMAVRSGQQVLDQLACDVQMVREIAGNVTRVSAMGAGAAANELSGLNVQMTTASGLLARWSIQPTTVGASLGITMIGPGGRFELESSDPADAPNNTSHKTPGKTSHETPTEPSAACRALDGFEQQLRSGESRLTWDDACRDLEVVDAVQQGLRRGRTIDVQNSTPTEEAAFKGIMAMGGCVILLLVLFAIFGIAVVDGVLMPYRDGVSSTATDADQPRGAASETTGWPLLVRLWPVYPLVVFVLLQLLLLVFRPRSATASSG